MEDSLESATERADQLSILLQSKIVENTAFSNEINRLKIELERALSQQNTVSDDLVEANMRSGVRACMWCFRTFITKKYAAAFHRWLRFSLDQSKLSKSSKQQGSFTGSGPSDASYIAPGIPTIRGPLQDLSMSEMEIRRKMIVDYAKQVISGVRIVNGIFQPQTQAAAPSLPLHSNSQSEDVGRSSPGDAGRGRSSSVNSSDTRGTATSRVKTDRPPGSGGGLSPIDTTSAPSNLRSARSRSTSPSSTHSSRLRMNGGSSVGSVGRPGPAASSSSKLSPDMNGSAKYSSSRSPGPNHLSLTSASISHQHDYVPAHAYFDSYHSLGSRQGGNSFCLQPSNGDSGFDGGQMDAGSPPQARQQRGHNARPANGPPSTMPSPNYFGASSGSRGRGDDSLSGYSRQSEFTDMYDIGKREDEYGNSSGPYSPIHKQRQKEMKRESQRGQPRRPTSSQSSVSSQNTQSNRKGGSPHFMQPTEAYYVHTHSHPLVPSSPMNLDDRSRTQSLFEHYDYASERARQEAVTRSEASRGRQQQRQADHPQDDQSRSQSSERPRRRHSSPHFMQPTEAYYVHTHSNPLVPSSPMHLDVFKQQSHSQVQQIVQQSRRNSRRFFPDDTSPPPPPPPLSQPQSQLQGSQQGRHMPDPEPSWPSSTTLRSQYWG